MIVDDRDTNRDCFMSFLQMAQPAEPSMDEVESKQRIEFLDFKEDEKKFLEDLGLLVQEEEPLPEV